MFYRLPTVVGSVPDRMPDTQQEQDKWNHHLQVSLTFSHHNSLNSKELGRTGINEVGTLRFTISICVVVCHIGTRRRVTHLTSELKGPFAFGLCWDNDEWSRTPHRFLSKVNIPICTTHNYLPFPLTRSRWYKFPTSLDEDRDGDGDDGDGDCRNDWDNNDNIVSYSRHIQVQGTVSNYSSHY